MFANLLVSGFLILFLMAGLWLISLVLKNSSIVDIFWGFGFVLSAWVYFMLMPKNAETRQWLILCLVTIWGLRLSLYILWRNWGRGEDFRYRFWRQTAGKSWWWRSFFKVFLLQGLLLWVISAPFYAVQATVEPRSLTWLDFLGLGLWVIGFFYEAVGDWQMAHFKSNPQNSGKVLDKGVWRYTRHPNYFGDATLWWGYYLIALSAGGWWTLFSPIFMTYLLLKVSGVALLEKTLKDTKPMYKEYIRRTSPFLPLPPKLIEKERI